MPPRLLRRDQCGLKSAAMRLLPQSRLLLDLLALAAVLGGVAAQDAGAAAAAASTPADFFEGRPINVCTSDYAPISRCLDRDPSQYTG